MMNTELFGKECKNLGFEFYTGVPCSFLKPLINYAINECQYVTAVNEGEAVSIAAGAAIGGKKAVVLMQNSGLSNASSPLTSLIYPFQIPILGFVSLRGQPGLADEPQHELMGQITGNWLTMMNINWEYLSSQIDEAKLQLQRAMSFIEKDQPFFFIVQKGTFQATELRNHERKPSTSIYKESKRMEDQFPTRFEALKMIHSIKDDQDILIATTGKTGRELFHINDAPNHLYMVGSMGCVSSLALGLSIVRPDKNVIAVDGDGALLMRMGCLATNGYYNPSNLLHILLDNETHDSTGGQWTVSPNVQFVDIAAACGYRKAIYIHNLDELANYISEWKQDQQLTFLHVKIAKGSINELGRPSLKPYEVKQRLQVFLND